MFPDSCSNGTKSSSTRECDGWCACIHHHKWRLSGLRSSHGWVEVYHSLWQPFTSTLHRSSLWSMSRTLLDCLQRGGGAVAARWHKHTETQRVGETKLDSCFVWSLQRPQHNSASLAKLQPSWEKIKILWSVKRFVNFGKISFLKCRRKSVFFKQFSRKCVSFNKHYGEERRHNETGESESEWSGLQLTINLEI